MITFRTVSGEEYAVAKGNEHEIIKALREGMFTDPGSNEKYMERLQNLIASMFNIWINAQDEKEFLKALVDLRILDKIE